MENKKSIGLPGGPNEFLKDITQYISIEGYKRYSKDINNPFNIIESGLITMEDVDFPVMGTDNLGNSQMMMPGNNYQFPGDRVFEIPMAQDGTEIPDEAEAAASNNSFLYDLEKLVNKSLGDINNKARDFSENPEEMNNIDNMRHASGGRYAAEAIQQKVRDLPYVGGLLDFLGGDKAAGFIGANAIGVGHELRTIFGGDERPFLAKLQEMGEDTFNNYVGSIVGSLNIDDSKKDKVIRYLSYNNLLPDGYVRTEQGKKDGFSKDIYFKDEDGKRKTAYQRGGGLLDKTMKCNSCGWSWKAADGGDDVSTCHKCGGSALPKAQYGKEKETYTREQAIARQEQLIEYANEYFDGDINKAATALETGATQGGMKFPDDAAILKTNYNKRIDNNSTGAGSAFLDAAGSAIGTPGALMGEAVGALKNGKKFKTSRALGMHPTERQTDVANELGVTNPVGSFFINAFTDPTSYFGAGAFRNMIKGAPKAGIKNIAKKLPGSPNAFKGFTNPLKNVTDLGYATIKLRDPKVIKNFKGNIFNTANVKEAVDEGIKRHNTVTRGVSTSDIALNKPEIQKVLKDKKLLPENYKKGDTLSDAQKEAIAKHQLTNFAPATGYGRHGISADDIAKYTKADKEFGALYTSNSYNTAKGYTYGDGYVGTLVRDVDLSKSNMANVKNNLLKNDPSISFDNKNSFFQYPKLRPNRYIENKKPVLDFGALRNNVGKNFRNFKRNKYIDKLADEISGNVSSSIDKFNYIIKDRIEDFPRTINSFKGREKSIPRLMTYGLKQEYRDIPAEFLNNDVIIPKKYTVQTLKKLFNEKTKDVINIPKYKTPINRRYLKDFLDDDIYNHAIFKGEANTPSRFNLTMLDRVSPILKESGLHRQHRGAKSSNLSSIYQAGGALNDKQKGGQPTTQDSLDLYNLSLYKYNQIKNGDVQYKGKAVSAGDIYPSGTFNAIEGDDYAEFADDNLYPFQNKIAPTGEYVAGIKNDPKKLFGITYDTGGFSGSLNYIYPKPKSEVSLEDYENSFLKIKEFEDSKKNKNSKTAGMIKAQDGNGEYRVSSGDTFYGIANKNNVTWDALKKANPNIRYNNLKLNQSIVIPKKINTSPYTSKPAPSKDSNILDYNAINNYLVKNRGGTKDTWGQLADLVAFHESGPAQRWDPRARQISQRADGSTYDGPGRGVFQFENESFNTALKRYKNIASAKGYSLKNDIVNAKSADELSLQDQYALFLANLIESRAKLSDFADGDISALDVWLTGHKNVEAKGNRNSFLESKNAAEKETVKRGYRTFQEGGEPNLFDMYSGYINGDYDGTEFESKAALTYDKLNRIYYREAKDAGMNIPNYIMTYVIGNS